MTDDQIIEKIKNSDDDGIQQLLKRYGALMRYVIAPILNNSHDTEDCLSEAVTRIWNKIYLYDTDKGSFKAWLTSLARNTALNYLKRTQLNGELSDDMPSTDRTPEEEILLRERRKALTDALDKMSQKDRGLIYRKYYYMQSLSQIASELGTTERAVEGRLYRLKKQLRKELGGEYFD